MTCDCHDCAARNPHRPDACRRVGKWVARIHLVDGCHTDHKREYTLCQQCFDAKVQRAKATIGWGMEGVRSPLCESCRKPLVRLSHIIEDVGKA